MDKLSLGVDIASINLRVEGVTMDVTSMAYDMVGVTLDIVDVTLTIKITSLLNPPFILYSIEVNHIIFYIILNSHTFYDKIK